MHHHKLIRFVLSMCLALILSACATTSSFKSNPLVVANSEQNAATIYLLRPEPLRTRGVADNDIRVEFGEQVAVLLSAGEYVALKIKPGKTEVTIRSFTYLTSKPMPEEVWRTTEFDFEKEKNYLIHAKFTQEEFRGIYFAPTEIDVNEAKQFGTRLKPHGSLAKAQPIESL